MNPIEVYRIWVRAEGAHSVGEKVSAIGVHVGYICSVSTCGRR